MSDAFLRQVRSLPEVWHEVRGHVGGELPAFVWARDPRAPVDEVPVFVFHSMEPQGFEQDLLFLKENGYRTVTCDELARHLTGEAPLPPRSVMLTIDDGRASVWRYAVPLLERHGMKAVVFLIPAFVRDADGVRPRLFEGLSMEAAPIADGLDLDGLMTWPEIEASHRSGVIDFQSHTLTHHKVPVSDRVLGVVGRRQSWRVFDIPVAPGDEPLQGAQAATGYPVFEHDSLMTGRAVFVPDPGLVASLRERFADAPDDEQPARLREVLSGWRARHGSLGRLASANEIRQTILRDLAAARDAIENRLPGHAVRHLCYPYTIGSDLSVALSAEAGYATNFWGLLPGARPNRPGTDPFRISRLKSDFLFRLPGRGRRSMASIFGEKVRRRLSGRPVY